MPKPDGSLRMCVDWRALNKQTIKDRYPLPNINDLLDRLRGAKIFSRLDLGQAYMQLRIRPEDQPKTAFKTHIGLYQYRVLPFGLCNAPSSFVRAMDAVLAPFLNKFCVCFIDDILVYTKGGPEEHLRHLEQVFQALQDNHLYCNRDKCTFNKPEVKFLGHIVGRDIIKPDPSKVSAVKDWPVPSNQHEVRSFLGLANYFRRFIHRFAEIAVPLTALLRKDAKFNMTPQCIHAYEALKEALITAPVLAMPDFDKQENFEVVADASNHSIGAVLLQDGHPVAFESRKLTSAERNYHAYEREALAVLHALKVWRCYLEGVSNFKLATDHETLLHLERQPHLHGRQARWLEQLSRFNFTWEHRGGRYNVADPLSRIPHPVVSALTRSQMKSGLGGEEVNTSAAEPADATTTAGARKRKLTPIPVPPWEMAKQPRKAAEAAKRFIKQVTTGKEPSRNAGPKTTITRKPKGGKRVQWSEGLGKSQSGSDFAEFVRQKAIELEQLGSAGNAEKDSVVGTAGTADNWEHFKGLIKPAVGEYAK